MRYKFESDDDGHNYLLPEQLWELWEELDPCENPDCWEDDRWVDIESCGIDGIWSWTFENPKPE